MDSLARLILFSWSFWGAAPLSNIGIFWDFLEDTKMDIRNLTTLSVIDVLRASRQLGDEDIKLALIDIYERLVSLERQNQSSQSALLRIEKLLFRIAQK